MRKIIIIGGAPTVGKSTLARLLSEKLKLPWISTDAIREVMRKLVRKEDYPDLFDFSDSTQTAEEYLTSRTIQEIVDEQNKESEQVWKGVTAFMETDYVWRDFIIEGVAVLPKLVSKFKYKGTKIFPIFLIEKNEERIRDIVYKRGLWDNADTYSDEVKPIEVKWAKLFNEWLEIECNKYDLKPTVITNIDTTFEKLTKDVESFLKE